MFVVHRKSNPARTTSVIWRSLHVLETVDFKHPNFKVRYRRQWWIVKRQRSVSLAIPNVFVDPNGLSFAVEEKNTNSNHQQKFQLALVTNESLPATNGDHTSIRSHEELRSVPDARWTVRRGIIDTNPRIFDFVRYQGEHKWFTGAKISLTTTARVFGFSICPPTRTVSTKNLLPQTSKW